MSNQFYSIKWRNTINQLMEAFSEEMGALYENEQRNDLKHNRNDKEWFSYYGKLYLFYVDAYKALEDCYDQILHPQKRRLLKKMLENTMLRQLQIRSELVFYSTEGKAIRSDYINLDDVLFEEKRVMATTEVHLPKFFVDDFDKRKQYRKQMVDKFLLEFHDTNMPEEEVLEEKSTLDTNIETAIRIIQKVERGRQGIARAYQAKYLRKLDQKKAEKQKRLHEGTEIAEETEREDAILVIQKYYRGFKVREDIWGKRKEEQIFLGFEREVEKIEDTEVFKKQMEKRQLMKKKQQEHYSDYLEALDEAKEQLMSNWADDIKDHMVRERREWYQKEVEKTEGKFIPPKVQQFYEREQVRKPLTEEEKELRDIEDKQKKAKKKDKKKKKKKKGEPEEEKRVAKGPSEAVKNILGDIDKYTNEWDKKNENFEQTHEESLLKNEVVHEVEKQIQGMVDDMIDMELFNLRLAFKAKKYKYPKKKKDKKKKKKQKPVEELDFVFRSPKKKKKKFPGDKLTNKKDPRDMLAELIEAGIVKKLLPAKVEDFIGDPYPLRQKQQMLQDKIADPSMFDIRQYVTQAIGMPLGSPFLKDNLLDSNYCLFFGPHGSGKSHMVRALQSQCDALVIDLSPANIENKYTDKPEYMLNLSFKVAGYFQPSIIVIDEIEKIFSGAKKKKKKKNDPNAPPGLNYAKIKKFLLKFAKFYQEKEPENVLILGCTNSPWDANKKQLKTFFKKRVYFPCPNYATRMKLFETYFQEKKIQLHPSFPITTLAHLTEGYTAGNIKEALNRILTKRRIEMVDEIPYTINEFINPLSIQKSTFLTQYLKFREQDFHDEITGNNLRIKQRDEPQDDDDKKKKKPAKKKK